MKPSRSNEARSKLRASEKDALRAQFQTLRPVYERMATGLSDALEVLLESAAIPFLDVVSRVKDIDSALGKIERKQYINPFEEIEDWCGLRIICYYPADVNQIVELLQNEFDVQQEEDTSLRLQPHEFGYRSTHLILRIKEAWLSTPTYRGLGDLKAEVQVRTILMHAWAEIEHKLAYKKPDQVPDKFKRKLYRLSAKFEEADEQFEELRVGLTEYRKSIVDQAARSTREFANQELNLDTLQAFLDMAFPNRKRGVDDTSELFEEIINLGLTMPDLVEAYERVNPILIELEESDYCGEDVTFPAWYQVGAMRCVLDTANDRYYDYRTADLDDMDEWINGTNNARRRLAEFEKQKNHRE